MKPTSSHCGGFHVGNLYQSQHYSLCLLEDHGMPAAPTPLHASPKDHHLS
jgi:hypothetical protein